MWRLYRGPVSQAVALATRSAPTKAEYSSMVAGMTRMVHSLTEH